jgi:hypothetical protein
MDQVEGPISERDCPPVGHLKPGVLVGLTGQVDSGPGYVYSSIVNGWFQGTHDVEESARGTSHIQHFNPRKQNSRQKNSLGWVKVGHFTPMFGVIFDGARLGPCLSIFQNAPSAVQEFAGIKRPPVSCGGEDSVN